jgi:hypothetical protein
MTDSNFSAVGLINQIFNLTDIDDCKLNSFNGVPVQTCYQNKSKDGKYIMFDNYDDDENFSVMSKTLNPSNAFTSQWYLSAPFDSDQRSQIQFLFSDPNHKKCSQFPDGPSDCLKYSNDSNQKYCPKVGLPCAPGYTPQKVGPCIETDSGYSFQGWQCISNNYSCDLKSGRCQSDPHGPFSSTEQCQKNCKLCPSEGFTFVNNKCHRNPANYQAFKMSVYGSKPNDEQVCGHGYYQKKKQYCWIDRNSAKECRTTGFTCTNFIDIPSGAYYCDNDHWVQNNSSKSIAGPVYTQEQSTNPHRCRFPDNNSIPNVSEEFKNLHQLFYN